MKQLAIGFLALLAAAAEPAAPEKADTGQTPAPREPHLSNLRQLTFGGENAEAYFSFDGRKLVFQSTRDGAGCDRIYTMDVDGKNVRQVSNGKGRTTCGYWLPDGKRVLYASTYLGGADCPPPPDRSRGYVWAIYKDYDLFVAPASGGEPKRLTDTPGYDAEATISPDGKRIVWTSTRDGDLDLYSMNLDGTGTARLTTRAGYDGGAFFSPDSKRIVFRAAHPESLHQLSEYADLLMKGLVRPSKMEIWIMDADGKNQRQVTKLGGAAFAPYFTPDGHRILFASNHEDPKGREFQIYLIRDDGTGLERVTDAPPFNSFPMFSPDGKKLVFASNRNAKVRGETNLFLADWKD